MAKAIKTTLGATENVGSTTWRTAPRLGESLSQSTRRAELPNVHPADELQAVREEIKILNEQADRLRDQLLADGADLRGEQYTAKIIPGVRETLDKKALIEAFGEAAIDPFIKETTFKTVKLVEN
jgi:hypothetical protein